MVVHIRIWTLRLDGEHRDMLLYLLLHKACRGYTLYNTLQYIQRTISKDGQNFAIFAVRWQMGVSAPKKHQIIGQKISRIWVFVSYAIKRLPHGPGLLIARRVGASRKLSSVCQPFRWIHTYYYVTIPPEFWGCVPVGPDRQWWG